MRFVVYESFFGGFICLFTSCCHLVTRRTCLPLCHSCPTNMCTRLYSYLNQLITSVAVYSKVVHAVTAHCTDLSKNCCWPHVRYKLFSNLFIYCFSITFNFEYFLARYTPANFPYFFVTFQNNPDNGRKET